VFGLTLLRGKLKEVAICLRAGRVTLAYPFAPADPAPGFRGLPRVEASRCIGCGGCLSVCPSTLITVEDTGPLAKFTWNLARCTSCARCADACPEDAVSMAPLFENATDTLADLICTVEVFMASCNRCGRCYRTQTPLDPPHPRAYHEGRVDAICDKWSEGRATPAEARG